jgi:hypothetical protein
MVPFWLSRIREGSIKGNMVPFALSRIREGSIKDNMVPFWLSRIRTLSNPRQWERYHIVFYWTLSNPRQWERYHIVGSVFGPVRFLLPVCRLSWFLYTLSIYAHFSSQTQRKMYMQSPLMLLVSPCSWSGVFDTTLNDKICQWIVAFSDYSSFLYQWNGLPRHNFNI